MYNILFCPERCTVSTRVKVSSRNHLTASRPRSYLEDIRLVAEVQGYLDGLVEAALAAALTAQRHAGRDTRHDTTRLVRATHHQYLETDWAVFRARAIFYHLHHLHVYLVFLLYSTLPRYFGTAFINGGRRRHHSVLVKRQSKLSVGCLVAFV